VTDPTIEVRAGDEQPWDVLEGHLRRVLELPGEPMAVRQFSAGRANLTFLVTFGDVRLVVRRPPRGKLAPGAHDMGREHRVLSALADAYPRAPRSLHFCDDESVMGVPFIVLEHREGVVVSGSIPPALAGHADVERRVDLALLDAAADLHTVDPLAVGLGDLGRPEGFAGRQVQGWLERWRRAAPTDGSALMKDIAQRLLSSVPEPSRTSVVHLDLKLDNCQFDPTDPDTVMSVFDWDMATLGDPLFDLGLLLVSMGSLPVWTLATGEAAARYAERSGIDVRQLDWYVAFATWRTAVVLQQLYNRYTSGDTSDDRYRSYDDHIPGIAERARALLG
jgi:aminoglycoside phosphotransferase (APT) family kinase protein